MLGLPAVALAQPQNSLVWRTNYYSIKGNSIRELQRSMVESRTFKGPSNLVGFTEWRIDWRYNLKRTEGGCLCASFTTTTSITNTLPRWTPPADAPAELKESWTRYITALRQHEDGHSRLALASLADMHKKVKALGESPDCATMRRKINETAERVLEEGRKRDLEYDRRTNHGATQGAWLR